MRQATLLFLTKEDKILLAMKKRGYGENLWNGVGGKVNPDEDVIDAAKRECYEEISVSPLNMAKRAEIVFESNNEEDRFNVTVYTCDKWDGEPIESEEMAPKWFNISEIPYHQMWSDDYYWLPEILAGKNFTAKFLFDDKGNIKYHSISHI